MIVSWPHFLQNTTNDPFECLKKYISVSIYMFFKGTEKSWYSYDNSNVFKVLVYNLIYIILCPFIAIYEIVIAIVNAISSTTYAIYFQATVVL